MLLKRSLPYLTVILAVKVLIVRRVAFGSWGIVPFLVGELCFVLLVAALLDARRQPTAVGTLVADGVISALLAAVLVYQGYFGRVPSYESLAWAGNLSDVGASVAQLFRPAYLLVFADLPLLWLAGRFAPDFFAQAMPGAARKAVTWVAALAMLGNVVYGTVKPTPDASSAAYRHGLFNAQLIRFARSRVQSRVTVDASDPAGVQKRIEEVAGFPSGVPSGPTAGKAKGRSVIVILVESLQAVAVSRTVDGQRVTPALDALAADGVYFPNAYTQVSAGNTADAEVMVSAGLYPLGSKPLSEEYGDRVIPSLPRSLAAIGYAPMTFHPNDREYWNRDQLYPALGFTEIYDKDFYGDTDVIGIGSSDEALFAEALPELKRKHDAGTPFYAAFVTLTGHHPFEIPADRQRLKLPAEMRGTLTGDYLVSMNYADLAIGQFVDGLKKEGIYDDCVIVVVGDHFGLQQPQMSAEDMAVAEKLLGRPYNDADRINIPLIVTAPGITAGETVTRPVGQVDVVPTVAALLGLPLDAQVHFGRDALGGGPVLLGERYYLAAGTFIDDRRIVVVNEDTTMEAYDALTREPLAKPGAGADATAERVVRLQELSDAYVSALPKR